MMDRPFETRNSEKNALLKELTEQVVAAELHLTYFAARHGKDSEEYQTSLKDFATAWFLLKKNRDGADFHDEVKAVAS